MTPGPLQWLVPFLLALHFPLSLFAEHVALVESRETYLGTAMALVLVAVLVGALRLFLGDRPRTICLAAGIVVWTFGYGIFSRGVGEALGIGPRAGGEPGGALVPWTVFWLLYVVVVARTRSLALAARIYLLAAILMTAQPLVTLGAFVARERVEPPSLPPPTALKPVPAPPDIVYLVFDRYASEDTLRERYGFDNRALLDGLRDRGFHVPPRANANYFKTALSLAATLNQTHLGTLFARATTASTWHPLYPLLQDHRVWQALRPLGYEYVHLGSWWEPTRHNRHATRTLSYSPVPLFAHSLYRSTPFSELPVSKGTPLDFRWEQWHRVHRQATDLETLWARAGPRPLFVLAHFLLPHDPWIFGPDGAFLSEETVAGRTRAENYVNHVRFANTVIDRVVDALMADTTRPDPIIIVQADEGPFPARYEAASLEFDWRRATRNELREKFGILNAVYLPGVATDRTRGLVSPINTFRVVFNEYFGAGLDLLPDRSFVSVSDRRPYDFIDVTDVVAGE